MRIRLAAPTIEDLAGLGTMYEFYLTDTPAAYPGRGEAAVQDFLTNLFAQMMTNPRWFCVVAVAGGVKDDHGVIQGGKIKAAIMGFTLVRPLGEPREVGFCEMLVVDPKFRRKGIARKLVQVFARELFTRGAKVLECAWRPGTDAERMWLAMGVRSYQVYGAFTLEDGSPRTDLPVIPEGVGDGEDANAVPESDA